MASGEIDHIAIIIKKNLKERRLHDTFINPLRSHYNIEVHETSYAGHAVTLAKEVIENNIQKIIVVGGDGTLHEVVNGILNSQVPTTPLLYLPNGTANDWGKTHRPPETAEQLISRLRQSPSPFDVGVIEHSDKTDYFINIADVGMGAEVVRRVQKASWPKNPSLLFGKSIIQTFFSYKNQELTCHLDGELFYDGPARSIVAANGKFFGSGICIAPDADPVDGQFQVVLIGDVSLWDYLRYLPSLRKGRKINHSNVHYAEAQHIHIGCDHLATEADGEYVTTGGISITVKAKSIWLY